MEKDEYRELGFKVSILKLNRDVSLPIGEEETIWTNVAAYADDLILYSETP
jgi:hypothetical protein